MAAVYRERQVCAGCGAAIARAEAYLSSDGPVCDECHKREKTADRSRSAKRDANAGALLGGVLSTIAGAALLATGLIADAIFIRFHLACVLIVVLACVRVPRLEVDGWHGKLGKALALLGGVLGAPGVVILALRFA